MTSGEAIAFAKEVHGRMARTLGDGDMCGLADGILRAWKRGQEEARPKEGTLREERDASSSRRVWVLS